MVNQFLNVALKDVFDKGYITSWCGVFLVFGVSNRNNRNYKYKFLSFNIVV